MSEQSSVVPAARPRRRRATRRKVVALTVVGLGIAGLGLASAAQLTLTSGALGAGTTVVASCDNDGVTVRFGTTFQASAKGYAVSQVKLTGVADACKGQAVTVDLLSADPADAAAGTSLGQVTGVVGPTGGDVVIPVTSGVKASDVKGVAVVIAG